MSLWKTCAVLCGLMAGAYLPAPAAAAQHALTQPPSFETGQTEDRALAAAIASGDRSPVNRARDAWRHPYEALTFWGLTPGLTVVEIDPGAGGWWTEILAPYARATGGRYVAAWIDTANPETSEANRQARRALEAELAPLGGTAVDFGPQSGLAVADGGADLILVARAFHNWARIDGRTERYMAEFYRALKPGGVLAIEQHRAEAGANPAQSAPTGYVSEAYVVRAAQAAGFELEARSDLNANAADTRDHPFGVWTLAPNRRSEQGDRTLTPSERAALDAIGESDRMTLRLRKPE